MGTGEADRLLPPCLLPGGSRDQFQPQKILLVLHSELHAQPCPWASLLSKLEQTAAADAESDVVAADVAEIVVAFQVLLAGTQ